MAGLSHRVGSRWREGMRNAVFLTGLYSGLVAAAVLTGWLVVANRAPFLERFALERNAVAAGALLAVALVPVLRFLRQPGHLLLSGLTAWAVVGLVYRLLCLFFASLGNRMGAIHLFMLGAIAYGIVATLAWIGSLIWSVRRHHTPPPRHHLG